MQTVSSRIEQLLTRTLHRLTPEGCPVPHNQWRRLLSGAVRTIVPAPHKARLMEWEYGTWTGSFAGYDETGRQLGEANVLPEWLAQPLNDKWSPFKGPGTRQGRPFNVDAFREMGQCWADLMLDAAMLREHYSQHYLQQPQTFLSARDLFIIASVGVSVPGFLLRRGDNPVSDGELPRQAAAGFKVIGGMYAATSRMVTQAHPMLLQSVLDEDEFLAYLEAEHLLLSPESRACAAPERMIRQILGALIDPATDLPVDKGLQHIGRNDIDRTMAYGVLCAQLDVIVQLHWRGIAHYLRPLLTDQHTPEAVRLLMQEEVELDIDNDTPLADYITMAEHILPVTGDNTAGQAFVNSLSAMTAITVNNVTSVYEQCLPLEKAMQDYVIQQQTRLDELLRRPPVDLSAETWSPAPGSDFLKRLQTADPRFAVKMPEVE